MKRIVIVLVFLIVQISCKDTNSQKVNYPHQNIVLKEKQFTCEDIAYQIVKSSNLELRGRKEFLTQIDRIEEDNIIIQVYIENNISDNPKTKQIVESTIAWLKLNVYDCKLYNTSADPDNPIELDFDKKLLEKNNIFKLCDIVKKEKKIILSNTNIKYSILPVNFDEYYQTCVHPYDSIKCNENYPKYVYNDGDPIAEIFQGKFHPSEYMYLPKVKDYQPVLLCNTDFDIESYDLVIIKNNKIISSLEIGVMDGESIMQFNISKDYLISVNTKKNGTQKSTLFKTYKINQDGVLVEESLN
ncbi:hypothetical protein [Flavobacterium hercynium]|uniref:Uncharacterized protein n=1 Tax=Flavobacterium hercynium TaxID=387094 RepID=A0A226HBL6_9FLAO|nr:hypothetical protein [Flavobacterium hercynium]OXA91248.1 hypothetical protein B0A66_11775 [Flavobacterium hercynium]SMP12355.1 hypothetical protein SAMN06265346_103232 [Flavobacterium hercynium]